MNRYESIFESWVCIYTLVKEQITWYTHIARSSVLPRTRWGSMWCGRCSEGSRWEDVAQYSDRHIVLEMECLHYQRSHSRPYCPHALWGQSWAIIVTGQNFIIFYNISVAGWQRRILQVEDVQWNNYVDCFPVYRISKIAICLSCFYNYGLG